MQTMQTRSCDLKVSNIVIYWCEIEILACRPPRHVGSGPRFAAIQGVRPRAGPAAAAAGRRAGGVGGWGGGGAGGLGGTAGRLGAGGPWGLGDGGRPDGQRAEQAMGQGQRGADAMRGRGFE